MATPVQDCDNCQYPAPHRKKAGEEAAPQGAYQAGSDQGADGCSQCFYQPEDAGKTDQ